MSSSTTNPGIRPDAPPRIPAAYIGFWISASLVCAALWIGWTNREQAYLEAESGLGYGLGIVGGVMMLLLLLYPMRKHLHFMSGWYSVKFWFQLHMIFGAFGPVLILYHSNFGFGSTNSTIALLTMLIVAVSGLIGRYFFHRISVRKLERQTTLKEFREHPGRELQALEPLLEVLPDLREQLEDYSARALSHRSKVLADLWWLVRADLLSRHLQHVGSIKLATIAATVAERRAWGASETAEFTRRAQSDLSRYIKVAREATEYACLQELFSRWHHLHLPLFAMMVVTGITHVVAVHIY